MRRNIFYVAIVGFGGGVLIRSFFSALGGDFIFSAFLLLLAFTLFLLYVALHKRVELLFVAVFVLAAGLGVLRFDIADLRHGTEALDALVGERISAEALVINEPDERETNTKLIVLFEQVEGEQVSSKALVTVDVYPRFSYGDTLRLEGELSKPTGFVSDNDRYFDYAAFLAKDDVFYQMFFPKIELVSSGGGNPVRRLLFQFKNAFLEKIGRLIPEPEVSLLGGLVVGAKQSLGEKLQDDFRATGIIHIVVLSGYNVTIVAEAIMRFFSFLPRVAGLSIGATAIILFAIMTGASATIVRASIMALLVVLARATGRTHEITHALFLAGFVMILHNPKILAFDSSFQLSFMATLGLIWLAPKIEQYFNLVPTKFQLREFAVATIATQLFVLPMILYKMGELSLVALPVNLLILWFVPLTMLFGFLAGIFGFVHALLALPFAYVSFALLTYELFVVDIFASLPFASVQVAKFPLAAAIFIYVLYAVLLWWLSRRVS